MTSLNSMKQISSVKSEYFFDKTPRTNKKTNLSPSHFTRTHTHTHTHSLSVSHTQLSHTPHATKPSSSSSPFLFDSVLQTPQFPPHIRTYIHTYPYTYTIPIFREREREKWIRIRGSYLSEGYRGTLMRRSSRNISETMVMYSMLPS